MLSCLEEAGDVACDDININSNMSCNRGRPDLHVHDSIDFIHSYHRADVSVDQTRSDRTSDD